MTDLGYVALVLALALAIYGAIVSFVGGARRAPEYVASGRNAIYAVGALVLLPRCICGGHCSPTSFNWDTSRHTRTQPPHLLQDFRACGVGRRVR